MLSILFWSTCREPKFHFIFENFVEFCRNFRNFAKLQIFWLEWVCDAKITVLSRKLPKSVENLQNLDRVFTIHYSNFTYMTYNLSFVWLKDLNCLSFKILQLNHVMFQNFGKLSLMGIRSFFYSALTFLWNINLWNTMKQKTMKLDF